MAHSLSVCSGVQEKQLKASFDSSYIKCLCTCRCTSVCVCVSVCLL